jgi:F-type H+-transporting ATPase subunit b
MAGASTIATTAVPAEKGAGFPPFKTETFSSQIFWLVITFAFLFVVLWRVAGPRINGVITVRRNTINDDIAKAQAARGDAEAAGAAYDAALKGARARAQGLAEETRKTLAAETAAEKARADAEAHDAMAAADARIAASRTEARSHVARAAAQAAIEIVEKLTGDAVPLGDAQAIITGRK